jgi:hypothetical protein
MRPFSRCRERGAVLPEYALGVALVCLAIVGGVEWLGRAGQQRLDARTAAAGTPDEYTIAPSSPGEVPDDPEPPPEEFDEPGEIHLSAPLFTDVSEWEDMEEGDWLARVTVYVVDLDNNPVAGLPVTGEWLIDGDLSVTSCVTSSEPGELGTCTLRRSAIAPSALFADMQPQLPDSVGEYDIIYEPVIDARRICRPGALACPPA